jgi:adenine-specific DNA-methyltransferase
MRYFLPASDFCFPAGTRCEAPDGTEFSGTWGDTETVKLIKGRFLVKDNRLVEDVVLRAGWTQLEQMKKYFAGEDVIDTRGQRVLEFYFSSTGKLKYRKERKRITPSTVLEGYGTQSQATSELAELFAGTRMLDYPKPVRLIRDLVYWITECDEEDLVLDFFAGSCTTAQAVLELNHEDGGNRRFIMVQLPAPTPEGSAAREAGFTTVAEIGKERIRRVIARLKEEEKQGLDLTDRKTPEDLGFRVFKLAPSNYRSWTGVETMGEQPPDPQVYVEQLAMFIDTLDDGWTPPNVVAEVALKEAGFGLNYATETVQGLEGQTVYRVTDPDREQVFYLCLDDEVRLEALRPLGLNRDTLFVCRASALDDETAANLALQCRLKVI